MNKPLPQTIEDVEQMGLTWYVLFSDKKKQNDFYYFVYIGHVENRKHR